MPLEALVIFDCDGVLVDSEPIANRILARMLTEMGLPTTYDECVSTYVGLSMTSCLEKVGSQLERPVPASFVPDFREECRRAFTAELQAMPGIRAVVERLRVPFCVASSGDHEKIRTSLRLTGLLPYFGERIYSASDVPRGKPWPDLFLYAAAAMRIPPRHCVVVEDTVVGARAGAAAGMPVLGFAHTTPAAALQSAGARVFHHASELPALIDDVLGGLPAHGTHSEAGRPADVEDR